MATQTNTGYSSNNNKTTLLIMSFNLFMFPAKHLKSNDVLYECCQLTFFSILSYFIFEAIMFVYQAKEETCWDFGFKILCILHQNFCMSNQKKEKKKNDEVHLLNLGGQINVAKNHRNEILFVTMACYFRSISFRVWSKYTRKHKHVYKYTQLREKSL